MAMQEKGALASLLFETGGFELLDVKCFVGAGDNITATDIRACMHDGMMQERLQPGISSEMAPSPGVDPRNMVDVIKGLPVAA